MGDVLVKSRAQDEADKLASSQDTEQRTGEGRKSAERLRGTPSKVKVKQPERLDVSDKQGIVGGKEAAEDLGIELPDDFFDEKEEDDDVARDEYGEEISQEYGTSKREGHLFPVQGKDPAFGEETGLPALDTSMFEAEKPEPSKFAQGKDLRTKEGQLNQIIERVKSNPGYLEQIAELNDVDFDLAMTRLGKIEGLSDDELIAAFVQGIKDDDLPKLSTGSMVGVEAGKDRRRRRAELASGDPDRSKFSPEQRQGIPEDLTEEQSAALVARYAKKDNKGEKLQKVVDKLTNQLEGFSIMPDTGIAQQAMEHRKDSQKRLRQIDKPRFPKELDNLQSYMQSLPPPPQELVDELTTVEPYTELKGIFEEGRKKLVEAGYSPVGKHMGSGDIGPLRDDEKKIFEERFKQARAEHAKTQSERDKSDMVAIQSKIPEMAEEDKSSPGAAFGRKQRKTFRGGAGGAGEVTREAHAPRSLFSYIFDELMNNRESDLFAYADETGLKLYNIPEVVEAFARIGVRPPKHRELSFKDRSQMEKDFATIDEMNEDNPEQAEKAKQLYLRRSGIVENEEGQLGTMEGGDEFPTLEGLRRGGMFQQGAAFGRGVTRGKKTRSMDQPTMRVGVRNTEGAKTKYTKEAQKAVIAAVANHFTQNPKLLERVGEGSDRSYLQRLGAKLVPNIETLDQKEISDLRMQLEEAKGRLADHQSKERRREALFGEADVAGRIQADRLREQQQAEDLIERKARSLAKYYSNTQLQSKFLDQQQDLRQRKSELNNRVRGLERDVEMGSNQFGRGALTAPQLEAKRRELEDARTQLNRLEQVESQLADEDFRNMEEERLLDKMRNVLRMHLGMAYDQQAAAQKEIEAGTPISQRTTAQVEQPTASAQKIGNIQRPVEGPHGGITMVDDLEGMQRQLDAAKELGDDEKAAEIFSQMQNLRRLPKHGADADATEDYIHVSQSPAGTDVIETKQRKKGTPTKTKLQGLRMDRRIGLGDMLNRVANQLIDDHEAKVKINQRSLLDEGASDEKSMSEVEYRKQAQKMISSILDRDSMIGEEMDAADAEFREKQGISQQSQEHMLRPKPVAVAQEGMGMSSASTSAPEGQRREDKQLAERTVFQDTEPSWLKRVKEQQLQQDIAQADLAQPPAPEMPPQPEMPPAPEMPPQPEMPAAPEMPPQPEMPPEPPQMPPSAFSEQPEPPSPLPPAAAEGRGAAVLPTEGGLNFGGGGALPSPGTKATATPTAAIDESLMTEQEKAIVGSPDFAQMPLEQRQDFLRQLQQKIETRKSEAMRPFDATVGDDLLKSIKDRFWRQGY